MPLASARQTGYSLPMKNVLILDGALNRDSYRPTDEWRAHLGDVPSTSVHLPGGEPVPPLGDFSHVIVTGSEASIVRHKPWYDPGIAVTSPSTTTGAANSKHARLMSRRRRHFLLVEAISP